jgi:phosphoribosyl-ATP pyrophosphohydrolase/phosphoribosyl-AMP cyclohydrolase
VNEASWSATELHDAVRWNEQGLVPAIVQDVNSGAVLMLAYMNAHSLELTLETGETHFWSRSRQTLWHKGATSGNVQRVHEIRYDCDADALLVLAEPAGPACHTGAVTCFYRTGWPADAESVDPPDASAGIVDELFSVIEDRRAEMPSGSYTAELLARGAPRVAQKVGEEAIEVIVAALEADRRQLVYESADLIYHLLVLLASQEVPLDELYAELERRRH